MVAPEGHEADYFSGERHRCKTNRCFAHFSHVCAPATPKTPRLRQHPVGVQRQEFVKLGIGH